MAAALIVIGTVCALYGAFSFAWEVGVLVVGLLILAAGVDRA